MRTVIKTQAKEVHAWKLGDYSPMEADLLKKGKLVKRTDGSYEVFSLEATGAVGEMAQAGDYFKVDSNGFPYPIDKKSFEETHRPIGENQYEQFAKPLPAWTADEPVSEEIVFLQKEKGLELHDESPDYYFRAPLWGTTLTAAKDAVLVFYRMEKDSCGNTVDADFNFVARDEFEKTYRFL